MGSKRRRRVGKNFQGARGYIRAYDASETPPDAQEAKVPASGH